MEGGTGADSAEVRKEKTKFGICQSVNGLSQAHIGLWFYTMILFYLNFNFPGIPYSLTHWVPFWFLEHRTAMDRFILNMFSNVSERFGIGREDYSKCLVYHLEVESVNYRLKKIGFIFCLLPPSSHSFCWIEVKSMSWSKEEGRTRK